MRVDLQSLELLLLIAEKHSFTRAGEVLGLSQPRVSLLVRRMEDRFGFAIFHRSHGRVDLTDEGARLLERTKALMQVVEDFERGVEDIRRKVIGRLRIGTPNYTSQIPDRVWLFDEYALRHPGVTLEFVIDRSPPLVAAVEEGTLDVAAVTGPFEHHGLETLLLLRSTALMAVPQESPLAALPAIGPDDVKGVSVATYPAEIGPLFMERWYGDLQRAGAVLTGAKEAKAEAVLRFAARRRLPTTVQVWPGQNLPPASNAPDMVFKPIVGMDLAQELFLVRRAGDRNLPTRWLWKLAREAFGEGRTPAELFNIQDDRSHI